MAATFRYNFAQFRESPEKSFMFRSSFILEINLLLVVLIHTVNCMAAKVAVINDKWVQHSQMTVLSYLAIFEQK